jgi:hypothetical protein
MQVSLKIIKEVGLPTDSSVIVDISIEQFATSLHGIAKEGIIRIGYSYQ